MSIFSKPPKDGRVGDGQQKPEAQPSKAPAVAPANKQTAQRAAAPQGAPGATLPVVAPAPAPVARPASAPAPAPVLPVSPFSASAPTAANAPAVVVTRPIDVGAATRAQARPPAPNVSVGPPPQNQIPALPPSDAALRANASSAKSTVAEPAPVAPPAPPTDKAIPTAPPSSPALEDGTSPGSPGRGQHIERIVSKTIRMEVPPQEPPQDACARPTVPDIKPQEKAPSIVDTFERLLTAEDIDAGFARIHGKPEPHAAPEPRDVAPGDLAEVRTLFAQLAANHVRQIRDFLIDLRWSEATIDWVGICEPALQSLRRAADKLELKDLCAAIDAFSNSLSEAANASGRLIEGAQRDSIVASYGALAALMPQAFALDLDSSQREAAILQSLLLQIPEVRKVTLDKLYASGLTTLQAMRLATPGDVAATTGISADLAARIVGHFRTYHESARGAAHDATRTRERERVAELANRMRSEHSEFELASQSWSREAGEKKKQLRKARARTLLDIQVVLARLGEVDRLKELEKLSFERKLAYLESFLEEAREKYTAQS